MGIKGKFLAFIDTFQGLGKEVLAFACLIIGLPLLIKGFITGSEFVELVRGIGIAYISGATLGSTSDAILQHLKDMATTVVKSKVEKEETSESKITGFITGLEK